MSIVLPTMRGVLSKPSGSFDPDAADYFARIVSAGSSISAANKTAVNAFIVGCKSDGIWSAIKASCILAGADTLAGALVPLVGAAPTNNNFVAGDYSRVSGLKGDASSKWLNSNRNNNADPQNNKHMAVYCTDEGTAVGGWLAAGGGDSGASGVNRSANTRHNNANVDTAAGTIGTGFSGISRSSSSSYARLHRGTSDVVTRASQTPYNGNYAVFANLVGSPLALSDSRLSFYSIGESLNLSQLSSRLSTLMSSLS